MCGRVFGERVQVSIATALAEDRGVPQGDLTSTLTGQGSGHGLGSTGHGPRGDQFVHERHQLIGEPNRDLSAHPKMIPHWDSVVSMG